MTKLNIGLESAYDTIVNDYDLQTLNEIVNYGYGYVGCGPHILYDNAIEFFTKYPDEITRELVINYSVDFLSDILKERNGDLDMYMADLTFAFIELVTEQIVDEYEATTCEELSDDGYNPVRSMTDARYALA